jgi:hypothetical protein
LSVLTPTRKAADGGDQLLAQGNGGLLADRHHDRQGHAALAGRAVGRADDVGGRLVEVGVGQDKAVVLGPAHGLHALAGRARALEHRLGDVRAADEADGLDVGMVEDALDAVLVAMDDVEDARRQAGLHHQFGQAHRHRRIALGGLEDEGVAASDGRTHHPHRDHGREVERGDARHDAQGLAHRIDVDARTGALGVFALQQMRDTARELNDFQAAHDVALGVGDDLAVLGRQQLRQLIHVGVEQAHEVEHHPRPALRIGRRPGRLGRLGVGDGGVQLRGRGQRHARLDLAGVGIEDVAETAGRALDGATADEVGDAAHDALLLAYSEYRIRLDA